MNFTVPRINNNAGLENKLISCKVEIKRNMRPPIPRFFLGIASTKNNYWSQDKTSFLLISTKVGYSGLWHDY